MTDKDSETRETEKAKEKEKVRKAAQQLYSGEELDQMLSISHPKRWGIILTIFILLIALGVWAFLGRIPTEVTGRAVMLGERGVFTILSKTNGTVTNLFIREGDILAAGDPIATIHNPQLRGFITSVKKIQVKIGNINKELDILKTSFKTRLELYKEGLIAKSLLEDFRTRLIDKEINLEEANMSLASTFSDLEKVSSASPEAFQLAEENILSGEFNPEELEKTLTTVVSPEEGRVLEILVRKGDIIDVKAPLVWMERPQNVENPELVFYSYFPLQVGNRIKPGMSVTIEPTTVDVQEYGSIIGKVVAISPFTLSEQELIATLGNRQLVKYLTEDLTSVIQVIIAGKHDPSTKSGFAWTSGKGPPFKIQTGSVSVVKVLVEEQPPISYLIPLWKLKPY